jgi:hypothetical protein
VSRRSLSALALAAALVARAEAGELEGALLMIEAAPGTPGSEPQGAPPRFALLEDGQVFVGGTSSLETTRLSKDELQPLRKRIEAVRKAVERNGPPSPDPGASAIRVRFLGVRPVEALLDSSRLNVRLPTAGGAVPPPALQQLEALVGDLLRYDHPGLVRYGPASYALSAQRRALVGGCRPWTLAFRIEDALAAPVAVYARDVVGWPTGAMPASVCVDDKRFVVTLRPLLPGERP